MRSLFARGRKKAQQALSLMGGAATGVATLAIVLVVAFLIMAQARTQIVDIEGLVSEANATSTSLNATQTLTNALADIPGFVPIMVIAVIGAALLGLVALFRRSA
jgi:hypothetical protein